MRNSFLQVFLIGCFLLLGAALFRTQIFQGGYFRSLSDGNRIREVVIHAPRGIIFDRSGVPLVANLPAFRLAGKTISKEEAIGLEAKGELPEVDVTRSYLFGEKVAHLIGYVSETESSSGDKVGHGGVEEEYEAKLRGKDGKELVEVDAVGKRLRTVSTIAPIPGENLTLSIDASLQKVAYEQIAGKAAAVVATDPNTGAILALASSPSFDPNVFTDLTRDAIYRSEKIKGIFADPTQPLFDRAISGTYPAGSTFKIVTATAGLETGKITADFTIDDPGILVIGPYKFPNWKYLRDGGLQGTINVVSAIQKSNDIFFYETGGLVGQDDLVAWGRRFGLAKPLGVDLPGEAAGSLPTKFLYLGDVYHLAIGQGDLLVTPLQVNAWTSVIASGGKLCRPHVLSYSSNFSHSSNLSYCRDIGISAKTINLVRQGLVAACSPGGTAWPLFNYKVPVACKTGTAEYGDPANRTHAWLTAFAPACAEATAGKACQPTIAVTVLVEGGGEGDTAAAPLVKKILDQWFSK
ncbi:hypothetical protein HY440_00605 [Candidatus Microgenomates bacterium]|nr:hypothetical protein [Candidatus Microgenomates bacterium]